jgi:hypothetical protein
MAGVPLTVAQRLMRHSDPKMTANVYTDIRVLDLHGAVGAPPSVVPKVVPAGGTSGHFGALPGTIEGDHSDAVKA